MNIQTERLEDHTARFTVQIETERLERAKKAAAKKLARRVNIPGFRKGKAPYKVMISYLGEGPILEDALEELGNEVYKSALDESDVKPYGPGSLENFELDPQPTFKFVVPLQPIADLGDYRSVRLDYEAPVVTDDDVDERLKAMQEQEALVEESSRPVAAGNRVVVSIKGEYLDEPADVEAEAAADDSADTEAPEAVEDNVTAAADDEAEDSVEAEDTPGMNPNIFIDNDELTFSLTEDREPAPGFTDALVGANVDERREFEITYPDDAEEYEHLAGRHVKFDVTVKKIESVTLPELNDQFAARVTANEADEDAEAAEEPLTLLQLRMRIRNELEEAAETQQQAEYADRVLDAIIEQATFAYPDALLNDQIHQLLHHMDNDLRQRGLTLEDYMKVTGKTHDDLHVDYEDNAVNAIKRSLVMREIVDAENLTVTAADIDAEIDRISAQFGEQASAFRSIYDNPSMRANLENSVLNQQVMERMAAIARGQAPDLANLDEAPADETVLEAEVPAEDVDVAETVLEADSPADNESDAEASEEEGESS